MERINREVGVADLFRCLCGGVTLKVALPGENLRKKDFSDPNSVNFFYRDYPLDLRIPGMRVYPRDINQGVPSWSVPQIWWAVK